MNRAAASAATMLAACVAAFALPARAERRVAVVVGQRDGGEGTRPLRYAVADAERIHRVLSTAGGVAPQDAQLLRDPTADQVLRALDAAEARAGDGTVLFYYSGHARDGQLRLGRTVLGLAALRERLSRMPARLKVAVLDACKSGEFIRTKGGSAAPAFEVSAEPPGPRGLAVLASSAADEDSQESDLLGASFFTHYLASGLLGDADADQDGKVTLQEAYAYAYSRTVAQTAEARAGLQHPTYAYSLAGAGEAWLTDTGRARSALVLPAASRGSYVVVDAGRRVLVAEIDKPGGVARRVALPPGRYEVKRREGDGALFARVRLGDGDVVVLEDSAMQHLALARNVSKGADWAGELAAARPGRWTIGAGVSRQVFLPGARSWFFPDLTLAGVDVERRDVFDSPHTVVSVDAAMAPRSELALKIGALEMPTQVSMWSAGASWLREFELGRWTPYAGGRLSVVGVRRTFADAGRFPAQSLLTMAPGVVAGLNLEITRSLSVGVRARASYLLYRTEEDASLGYGDLGLVARWEP